MVFSLLICNCYPYSFCDSGMGAFALHQNDECIGAEIPIGEVVSALDSDAG